MNKDEIGGKAEQVTGKIKEKVGEAIGNQNMANQGVADQVKGAAKETWGKAKDVAHDIGDRHRDEAANKATDARNKVVDTVDNLKNKIKAGLDDKNGSA